jgi:hypothetical protein
MKDVTHLVEEGDDVVMQHERRLARLRLRKVRDHRRDGIAASLWSSRRALRVTGADRKHGRVRILGG